MKFIVDVLLRDGTARSSIVEKYESENVFRKLWMESTQQDNIEIFTFTPFDGVNS